VVEEGEIKESGTHKSLMKKNGRYAELYNMQARRYLEE
jgi:ATP-binding cassette, subfamily B, bacterial